MSKTIKDIAFASQTTSQKLDVYLPDNGNGPFPVVVWLHPGGFMKGDKNGGIAFAEALADRGYATVSANYRLANEGPFPAQIYDAKAAVRWVRANASRYNLNPAKIAAWGVSAGTTLAAILGVSCGIKEIEDLSMGNAAESSGVQVVIAWYGPTDFVSLGSQRKQAGNKPAPAHDTSGENLLFGGSISQVPDKYRAASAIYYVNEKSPPFYIQHGAADEVIPCIQSINFYNKLVAAIGKDKVELHLIENAGHFDKVHSEAANIRASIDFLDKHLK